MLIEDLDTPAVVVDLDVMEANLRRCQTYLDRHGLALRPHIKTHKIPDFAHLQLKLGAKGITCQKLGEAEVMVDAGIADILLTYNIVGRAKLDRLVALARRADIKVVADSAEVVDGLVGHHVPCRPDPAGAGGMRHGSRTLRGDDAGGGAGAGRDHRPRARPRLPRADDLSAAQCDRDRSRPGWRRPWICARPAGLDVAVVSNGGTPDLYHAHEVTAATEHRPGTYIYSDRSQVEINGLGTWDDCALRVHATVVSHPAADRCIIDAGSKSLSSDLLGLRHYGHIVEHPDWEIGSLSEEHGQVHVPPGAAAPKIGERVTIIPNHVCVVTNLTDRIHAVRKGRVETFYAVAARGKVQ